MLAFSGADMLVKALTSGSEGSSASSGLLSDLSEYSSELSVFERGSSFSEGGARPSLEPQCLEVAVLFPCRKFNSTSLCKTCLAHLRFSLGVSLLL